MTKTYNFYSDIGGKRIVSCVEVEGKDEDEIQRKAEELLQDFINSLYLEEE